jgi:hypothetical protein
LISPSDLKELGLSLDLVGGEELGLFSTSWGKENRLCSLRKGERQLSAGAVACASRCLAPEAAGRAAL